MALILTSDLSMTDPDPSTPVVQRTLISDSFSGGDAATILGRTVDAFAGGDATRVWGGDDDGAGDTLEIVDGVAQRPSDAAGANSWNVGFEMAVADYEVTFDLMSYSVGSSGLLYLRRNYVGNNGYTMILGASGAITVQRLVSPTAITLKSFSGGSAPQVGDTIGLGINGNILYFVRNGVVLWAIEDSEITIPGWVMFNGVGAVKSMAIDNFVIRTPRTVEPTE